MAPATGSTIKGLTLQNLPHAALGLSTSNTNSEIIIKPITAPIKIDLTGENRFCGRSMLFFSFMRIDFQNKKALYNQHDFLNFNFKLQVKST